MAKNPLELLSPFASKWKQNWKEQHAEMIHPNLSLPKDKRPQMANGLSSSNNVGHGLAVHLQKLRKFGVTSPKDQMGNRQPRAQYARKQSKQKIAGGGQKDNK
jgi:hypothetical protein